MNHFFAFGFLAILAGCAVAPPPSAPVEPPKEACAQDAFSKYLWRPEADLAGITLPASTRLIRPDMAVTMDYRPDRLNIFIGKSGRVERVYCG